MFFLENNSKMITSSPVRHFKKQIIQQHEYSSLELNNPGEPPNKRTTRTKKLWKKKNCRGQFRHEDIHLIKLGEGRSDRGLCKRKEDALNRIYNKHLKVPITNDVQNEELPLNLVRSTVPEGNTPKPPNPVEVNPPNGFTSVIRKNPTIKSPGGIPPIALNPPERPPPPPYLGMVHNTLVNTERNFTPVKIAPVTKTTDTNTNANDPKTDTNGCVGGTNLDTNRHGIVPKQMVPPGDCGKNPKGTPQFVQNTPVHNNGFDPNSRLFRVVLGKPNGESTGGYPNRLSSGVRGEHRPPLIAPLLQPNPTQPLQKIPLDLHQTGGNYRDIPIGSGNSTTNHTSRGFENPVKKMKVCSKPPEEKQTPVVLNHQNNPYEVPYRIHIVPTVEPQIHLNSGGGRNNQNTLRGPVDKNNSLNNSDKNDGNNNRIPTIAVPLPHVNSKFPFITNSGIRDYHNGFSKCIREVLSHTASIETYRILLNKYEMLEKDTELIERYAQNKRKKKDREKFDDLYGFLKESFAPGTADELIKRIERERYKGGTPPPPGGVASDCIDLTSDGDGERADTRVMRKDYEHHPRDYFSGDVQLGSINTSKAALERIAFNVFNHKDVLTPEEYCDEIIFLEYTCNVPEIIKEFYKYVSKVQIRMYHEPISFRVFLDLFVNNRLIQFERDFHEYCLMRDLQAKEERTRAVQANNYITTK